ncbi:hypothetical protein CLV98_10783 [Dyadobacter jejuensis]|uniref:Outer membrane protein with beta-barrel domain n=1 Tax=Dyadobacter jejuensis TaxID=1082580 RepID=A0A316AI38_9BACT|nr:hypothetical protein [Dyadobacter jejuensis]PWJ57376.1 hypothetical protein CLV98_10783 [Dyadobacter jejuensis]
MKALIRLFCLLLLGHAPAYSQSADQNAKRADIGLSYVNQTVFLKGGVDYAVMDQVFCGIDLMLHPKDKVYTLNPAIRISYYFNNLLNLKKDNIDLFGGIGLSKNFIFNEGQNTSTKIYLPVHFGLRYFFNERMGIKTGIVLPNRVTKYNILELGLGIKI